MGDQLLVLISFDGGMASRIGQGIAASTRTSLELDTVKANPFCPLLREYSHYRPILWATLFMRDYYVGTYTLCPARIKRNLQRIRNPIESNRLHQSCTLLLRLTVYHSYATVLLCITYLHYICDKV